MRHRGSPSPFIATALAALAVLWIVQPGAEARPDYPDFNKVTKDMESLEGMFTLYRYKRSDKKKDQERLLCRIPASMLGKDFLFATTISSGGSYTSWMWNDYLIRWEIRDRTLLMVTPPWRYLRDKKDNPVTDVVKRTYPKTWLTTLPILTMAGGDPVIDLGPLLKSNIARIPGGYPSRSMSKWTKVKVFQKNVLVGAELVVGNRTMEVGYSFRKLPPLGSYKPRKADDRVGYFMTVQQDWTKPTDSRDLFIRLISRWKLEKQDPTLELSPPKKPIVFIIEKTVPYRWRRYVRQGIVEWNKAFEKLGYIDAVVCHQQTENNEFKDIDPEDARYNFFRWIVSGSAFAMGPSRIDPRTGQILDADIIMDDSMVRAFMNEVDIFAPGTAATHKGRAFKEWIAKRPQRMPTAWRLRSEAEQRDRKVNGERKNMLEEALDRMRSRGRHICARAAGMRHQMSVAAHAMVGSLGTAAGKKIPERFFGEIIRETVAHEVGHTLGLRHNFKASSWLSLEEIQKRRREGGGKATTASVMDYNPILFFAGDDFEKVKHFTTPTIGPYDYWAIEYGYADPKKGQTEEKFVAAVAAKGATGDGLAYATDEDTNWVVSPDPYTARYDLSNDPVAWAKSRAAMCNQALQNLEGWAAKKGESRSFLRRAFDILNFEKARNFDRVVMLIGGEDFNRDHVGDPKNRPSFKLVAPDRQRAALKALGETVFNDSFFKTDPKLLNMLAPSRWDHWGAWASARLDYPIHEQITQWQWWVLIDLTMEDIVQRVYNQELKSTAPNKFTAAELIRGIRDMVWTLPARDRAFTDQNPYLTSIRRGLQREYLNLTLDTIRLPQGFWLSPDLQGMIRHSTRELTAKIGRVLNDKNSLDFASRAHLVECKSRIDRILAAQFSDR